LRGTLAGTQSAVLIGGDSVVRVKAIAANIKKLDSIWILTLAAGAMSLISGVAMKRENLALNVVGA